MKKTNFFVEAVRRWRLPSPAFFVKLQNIGIVLTGIAGIVTGAEVTYPEVKWVVWLSDNVALHVAIIGGMLYNVGKFAVKPDVPNHKL